MIGCWIESIDANGIGAQLLKDRDIALAALSVGERVGVAVRSIGTGGAVGHVVLLISDTPYETANCQCRSSTGLSMYTSDAQLSPIGAIEEFGALDDDGVDVGESVTDEHAHGRSYDQAQILHREQMQKTKPRGRN